MTYWNDTGDVYGAFFGDVRARESDVPAQITVLASGPLIARAQAVFVIEDQRVVKTVTMHANDSLIKVELDISSLPETTAIAETSTILDTDIRTDDLDFGAFTHRIDAQPIAAGDRTYRRSIFYPIMYWSDVSSEGVGLTLITHGLQGVSGGATRGVMLIREVTQDKEGVTDPGVHHLLYAYYPHEGNAIEAQPWKFAYEFNQPLISVWITDQILNVQIPFDQETGEIDVRDLANGSELPTTYSLLSSQDRVITDLYRLGDQIEVIAVNYDSTQSGSIQFGTQKINFPKNKFTLLPLPLSAFELPPQ